MLSHRYLAFLTRAPVTDFAIMTRPINTTASGEPRRRWLVAGTKRSGTPPVTRVFEGRACE